MPDDKFEGKTKIILGLPLLMNYYTVVDVQHQKLALVTAKYSVTSNGLTFGAIAFLVLIGVIIMGGVIGCVLVYKRNKRELAQ